MQCHASLPIPPVSPTSRRFPEGTDVLILVAKMGYASRRRHVRASPGGQLTVTLEPVELLQLSVHLDGCEDENVPRQQMLSVFRRPKRGELQFVETVCLTVMKGRARAIVDWPFGPGEVVGRLSNALKQGYDWEEEAVVRPYGLKQLTPGAPTSRKGVYDRELNWTTHFTFPNLGGLLKLRFLEQNEAPGSAPTVAGGTLVACSVPGTSRLLRFTTDAEGRVSIPVGKGFNSSLRFWTERPGLVSPTLSNFEHRRPCSRCHIG